MLPRFCSRPTMRNRLQAGALGLQRYIASRPMFIDVREVLGPAAQGGAAEPAGAALLRLNALHRSISTVVAEEAPAMERIFQNPAAALAAFITRIFEQRLKVGPLFVINTCGCDSCRARESSCAAEHISNRKASMRTLFGMHFKSHCDNGMAAISADHPDRAQRLVTCMPPCFRTCRLRLETDGCLTSYAGC